jgi:hypothetical protein
MESPTMVAKMIMTVDLVLSRPKNGNVHSPRSAAPPIRTGFLPTLSESAANVGIVKISIRAAMETASRPTFEERPRFAEMWVSEYTARM